MTAQIIHQNQPTISYGTSLEDASAAVLLLHGRGATSQSMLELAAQLPTNGIAYLLPQAANNTWYPNSGFDPFIDNEPYLSSAMTTVELLLERIQQAGVPLERTIVGGFSQGACLTSEFTARNARRYGGLLLFSGALMGPPATPREYEGSLQGTPVYMGGIDNDPWVTEAQLRETAAVLEKLGGDVTIEVRQGSEHAIRRAEIEQAKQLVQRLV
jgi:phospholipase/carboxylesterase